MIAAIALTLIVFPRQVRVVYVSPTGNDAFPGTRSQPLKTPSEAIRRLEAIRSGIPDEKVVAVFRSGTYELPDTLTVGPRGAGRVPMILEAYRGEKAVLSGGVRLRNWKRSGNRYVTTVPDAFPVNQLFVGPHRYRRPVFPEHGFLKMAAVHDPNVGAFQYTQGDLNPDWRDDRDVEVLIFEKWEMQRIPLGSVDAAHNTVRLAGPFGWVKPEAGTRYVFENVAGELSMPGQFYFDPDTRRLTVIPLPGDDPATDAFVPKLTTLMRIQASNVTLQGLEFRHSAWTMPATGRIFPQAEADLPGAVAVEKAQNVLFDNCRIRQTGGYALELLDGAQRVRFDHGEMTDLGAGGVKVGGMAYNADESAIARENAITNSLIAGGGRVHPAAVGVWIGHSPYNTIRGNEIADFYYTGVSVGWSWGYGPSNAHHNLIADNHIHDIGQGLLSDMGGIYHLGVAPGTVISGNVIHDVTSFDYGGWGLYTDEGSSGVRLENNIVYDCSRESIHQHYGKENVFRHNILAFAREAQLARTRQEDHLSFSFDENIVIYRDAKLLWDNWGPQVEMDRNLYWRTDGKPVEFDGYTRDQWEAMGRDRHALFTDPQFVDAEHHDFRLKPTSPALTLGFKAMDPAGKPPKSEWKRLPPAWPSLE